MLTDDQITAIADKHATLEPDGPYLYTNFDSKSSLIAFVRECIAAAPHTAAPAADRAVSELSDDELQWEISAESKNPARFDVEYGRRVEALVLSHRAPQGRVSLDEAMLVSLFTTLVMGAYKAINRPANPDPEGAEALVRETLEQVKRF